MDTPSRSFSGSTTGSTTAQRPLEGSGGARGDVDRPRRRHVHRFDAPTRPGFYRPRVLDVVLRHSFVRELLAKLADRDQQFERLSVETLSRHRYVQKLLLHIAELSQELKEARSKAPHAGGAGASSGSGSGQPAAGQASDQVQANVEDSRSDALAHFNVRTVAKISVRKLIYALEGDDLVSDTRYKKIRESADDEAATLHKEPDIASHWMTRSISFYAPLYPAQLEAAMNRMVNEFPELVSKGNWKAKYLIDHSLRLTRTPNKLFVPKVKGEDDIGPADEDDDDEAQLHMEQPEGNHGSSNQNTDPPAAPAPSAANPSPPAVEAPSNGSPQLRLTAEGNPHNPASKTPAAQVADNPTSSRAPSSVLPPSTPTASSIALIRQSTAAKSPEKAHDRYTALNAILKRSYDADPKTIDKQMKTGATLDAPDASLLPSMLIPRSSPSASLIDLEDVTNLPLGRQLCKGREPTFDMRSLRPTIKRLLLKLDTGNPFTADEMEAAHKRVEADEQAKARQKHASSSAIVADGIEDVSTSSSAAPELEHAALSSPTKGKGRGKGKEKAGSTSVSPAKQSPTKRKRAAQPASLGETAAKEPARKRTCTQVSDA
ncbi:hypothetical protein V8E36_009008 [Tilletia maclaganii]